MNEKITDAIKRLKSEMDEEGIDPREGLPKELFIFATMLIPMVNIDMLILNGKGQFLLSWREDQYHGKGWHIPGGCLRLKERLRERVLQTAINEIGCEVSISDEPLCIKESICEEMRPQLDNQLERSHGISFLYRCELPNGYEVPETVNGTALRWFDEIPEDFLPTHRKLYEEFIKNYIRNKRIKDRNHEGN